MADTATRSHDAHSLREVFAHALHDLYDAEQQIVEALPGMADLAASEPLATALRQHAGETARHLARLSDVFGALGLEPRTSSCEGMRGILAEGRRLEQAAAAEPARDAALIAVAQRVEHYEVAAYGTLTEWANEMGLDEVAAILHETLDEERHADSRLTAIARGGINRTASGDRPDMAAAGRQQAYTAIGPTTRREASDRFRHR